jgi:hypothetical protein
VAIIFIIIKYLLKPITYKGYQFSFGQPELETKNEIVYNSISFEWKSTILTKTLTIPTLKSFLNSGEVVFY